MLKNNYRKIGKRKDNYVDNDVAQHEYNNIKRYALAFSNIQINTKLFKSYYVIL